MADATNIERLVSFFVLGVLAATSGGLGYSLRPSISAQIAHRPGVDDERGATIRQLRADVISK